VQTLYRPGRDDLLCRAKHSVHVYYHYKELSCLSDLVYGTGSCNFPTHSANFWHNSDRQPQISNTYSKNGNQNFNVLYKWGSSPPNRRNFFGQENFL